MTTKPMNARLAAMAAFGMTTLGTLSLAAAHPDDKPLPAPVDASAGIYGADDYDGDTAYGGEAYDGDAYDDQTYDADGDGVLEPVEIDYRRYDSDRDGLLGPTERTAYWSHMFDMGKLGGSLTRADKVRLARVAHLFDRNRDGRLTGSERVGLSRLVNARESFLGLDRNRDNTITRREVRFASGYGQSGRRYLGGRSANPSSWSSFYRAPFHRPESANASWIAGRFDSLDRDDNGRVTWGEVQSHIIQTARRSYR